jgi:flagellar biogenesis protein FliO
MNSLGGFVMNQVYWQQTYQPEKKQNRFEFWTGVVIIGSIGLIIGFVLAGIWAVNSIKLDTQPNPELDNVIIRSKQ